MDDVHLLHDPEETVRCEKYGMPVDQAIVRVEVLALKALDRMLDGPDGVNEDDSDQDLGNRADYDYECELMVEKEGDSHYCEHDGDHEDVYENYLFLHSSASGDLVSAFIQGHFESL